MAPSLIRMEYQRSSSGGYKKEDFGADFVSLFSDLWLKTTKGAKVPAAAAATMAAAQQRFGYC